MNPIRKQRALYTLLLLLCVSAATALILFALKENINHFYTPSQIVQGQVVKGQRIRAGGMVVPGSIQRDNKSFKVRFQITDGNEVITVKYEGILPDLFVEDSGVVTIGELDEQGVFIAKEIIARHDPKYKPPEVQKAIDKALKNKKKKN